MRDTWGTWFGLRRKVSREDTVSPGQEPAATAEASADTADGAKKIVTSIRGLNLGGSKVSVVQDNALAVMAYKRALDVLAGSVARLPFLFMKRKGSIYVPFEASPLHYMLTVEPQQRLSSYQWKYQMVWRAFHDGDAYIWPRIVDGEIAELVLISRGCCTYDSVNNLYTVSDLRNGVYGVFPDSGIIHIMFNTLDGFHGVPLWKLGGRVLSIAATGDKETLERFAKGGNVRGIVSNNVASGPGLGQYGDDQLTNIAEDLETKFEVEGRNIAGVPGDAKFTQFSMSSAEMQFLDNRKFSVIDISRMSGVPPVYLYDGGSSNYKEPEQTDVAFLTQTLDGILCSIEAEFQRKLVGRTPGRKFEFERKRIFSMNLTSMANYQAKTMENGIYSINDWRRYENQPPVDGGDAIYISTNRAQLGSDKLSMGAKSNDDEDNE